MKQTKHTPGPWMIQNFREKAGHFIRPSFAALNVAVVAENGEEGKANARLIAAAPELLEALRMIVGVFNLDRYGADTGGGKCYAKTKAAIAKVAIAKAEGN